MRWLYILVLPVTAGIILSPLLWLPAQNERAEYDAKGLIVRYDSYGAPVKSVDPATCGDTTSSAFQGNVYEGLYCYHYLKRPPEVIPQLADGMGETSDGLTYTIRIKKGVKFHRNPCFGVLADGTGRTRTVRADDFVLAFKRIADYHVAAGLSWALISGWIEGLDEYRETTRQYKAGDFSRYDLDVAGIKALDEHTLQIRLKNRFPQFIYVLAMHLYAPVPREAVDYWLATEDDGEGGRKLVPPEKRSTEFREAEQVVGTGPYLFDTFQRKSRIVLTRNPEFREDFYPTEGMPGDAEAGMLADAGKQVPLIDVLHYDYVAESYSGWMRFLSKQTDVAGIPKETFSQVITPGKELTERWKDRHIYLKTYSAPMIYWIVFNMEDPVVGASKSLRQALSLAFDVENYIEVIFNGRGKRAANIVPSSFKGHVEAGPGPYFRLDVEAATEKIRQAKAELNAAGLLDNGQIPALRLDVGSDDPVAVIRTDFIKQQFAKVGLTLRITFNDWPTLQEKVHNKRTQMYTMGWHADYPDAENFLQLFYSPNIARGTNDSNYTNPEFDRLYEQVRTMDDTPERTEMYVRMIRMIGEDCPVLPLDEPTGFVLYYEWVKNVKRHPIGYGFSKYVRIDEDLRRRLRGR